MILVCAATATEADACRRGIADASVAGFDVLTVGVGPARAAAALSRRLSSTSETGPASRRRPALVVSSGFAGTVSPGIAPLQWVTAATVHRLAAGRAIEIALPAGLLRVAEGAAPCNVISSDRVLTGCPRDLSHPAVADMESAALAEVAAAAGIPFAVLRLVTDTPARPLATLGRRIADVLAADDISHRALHGARAALAAARSPSDAVAFVRESLGWRDRLREGWREHARRGVPLAPAT